MDLDLFASFDTNNDGQVTLEEYYEAAVEVGEAALADFATFAAKVQGLWRQADGNGDGWHTRGEHAYYEQVLDAMAGM